MLLCTVKHVTQWNMSHGEACHTVKHVTQWKLSHGETCRTVKHVTQWNMSHGETCHTVKHVTQWNMSHSETCHTVKPVKNIFTYITILSFNFVMSLRWVDTWYVRTHWQLPSHHSFTVVTYPCLYSNHLVSFHGNSYVIEVAGLLVSARTDPLPWKLIDQSRVSAFVLCSKIL